MNIKIIKYYNCNEKDLYIKNKKYKINLNNRNKLIIFLLVKLI